jgi:hypothetical protein
METLTHQVRELWKMRQEWIDAAIKKSLIGSRITGIEMVHIPGTKHLFRFELTTDAESVEIGNVKYDLSMIVLKVKL